MRADGDTRYCLCFFLLFCYCGLDVAKLLLLVGIARHSMHSEIFLLLLREIEKKEGEERTQPKIESNIFSFFSCLDFFSVATKMRKRRRRKKNGPGTSPNATCGVVATTYRKRYRK